MLRFSPGDGRERAEVKGWWKKGFGVRERLGDEEINQKSEVRGVKSQSQKPKPNPKSKIQNPKIGHVTLAAVQRQERSATVYARAIEMWAAGLRIYGRGYGVIHDEN